MTKALIIGGGVAGPVAAIALYRAGIEPIVYEAYPQTSAEVGSYLTVATNGLDALRALDAHQPVLSAGFSTRHLVLWSGTGKRLGQIPIGGTLPDGTVSITIKRAHLYRALHDQATRRGIPFAFGKRLLDAETTPQGGIIARFEDGTPATGALLIGCDGVHSRTRQLIDPTAPSGRYVGLVNCGGSTPDLAVPVAPGVWHMVFGTRAFFSYVVDGSGGIVWFANVPRGAVSLSERHATPTEQWQRELIDLFTGDRSPTARIIAAGALELAADNTYDLPTVPMWHRGPMLLIGDAAHAPSPTSGQGASMAMEDAVVLAKCLRDVSSLPQAFATYERLRRHRVERIVAEGARQSSNKTPGPVGRKVRDVLLPFVCKFLVTEKSLRWMFNHHIDLGQPRGAQRQGAGVPSLSSALLRTLWHKSV